MTKISYQTNFKSEIELVAQLTAGATHAKGWSKRASIEFVLLPKR